MQVARMMKAESVDLDHKDNINLNEIVNQNAIHVMDLLLQKGTPM